MKAQASPKIDHRSGAEPELLTRARAGDRDAFGQLYAQHHDMVLGYIRPRVLNRPTAEDLTADTFVRALRKIETFTWQGKDFSAWLVTIARNLVADHYKSGRSRFEVAVEDMLDVDRKAPGAEELALRQLTTEEHRAAIEAALTRLTPGQQAAVRLRFLEDHSVQATAEFMELSEGAVKTVTCRAKVNLQRTLAHLAVAA